MTDPTLTEAVHGWDEAMVANDADAIGQFMADEWVIVGPDGSITRKADFLSVVASGDLHHDVMTSEDLEVRQYGETAVVLARGVSGGTFRGQPFREVERASNVFLRRDGRWVCALTHLSTLARPPTD